VLSVSPVILLVKTPVPLSSIVLLLLIVGDGLVLQHTPLAVTDKVPAEVTFPPHVALVWLILLTSAVFTAGGTYARVVNVFSAPYEVPVEFVA
jgi:hypothetical protein